MGGLERIRREECIKSINASLDEKAHRSKQDTQVGRYWWLTNSNSLELSCRFF